MSPSVSQEDLDIYITEIWSYLLYKKGKKLIGDIDPPSRIRKGIWRDEGVDMTEFIEHSNIKLDPGSISWLADSGKVTVRKGFLRRKKEHTTVSSIKPIGSFLNDADEDEIKERSGILASSNILFPFLMEHISSGMGTVIETISVERRPQIAPEDLSPDAMMKSRRKINHEIGPGENIKRLFHRSIKGSPFRTPSGTLLKNLNEIFRYIMTCEDDELEDIIVSGSLIEFASKELSSNVFEGLFRDLSTDPSGDRETSSGFRIRLGRWGLESPVGDEIVDEIVPSVMNRLMSCSEGEAMKLEEYLHPLMDPRSTELVTRSIFEADQERRSHLIRLLGSTKDRSAMETLKRLRDYSNVEADRSSAVEALEALGFKS